jgi:hypothetical protein
MPEGTFLEIHSIGMTYCTNAKVLYVNFCICHKSVIIVVRLWAGVQGIGWGGGRHEAESVSSHCPDRYCGSLILLYTEIKRPGRESDNSCPHSAQIKNISCICNSAAS